MDDFYIYLSDLMKKSEKNDKNLLDMHFWY